MGRHALACPSCLLFVAPVATGNSHRKLRKYALFYRFAGAEPTLMMWNWLVVTGWEGSVNLLVSNFGPVTGRTRMLA